MSKIKLHYREGKWESDSPLEVSLSRQIENIQEFGVALERFLKWKEKELPFKVIRTERRLYQKKWDGDRIYYCEGSLLLVMKELSWWGKRRRSLRTDKCSIVIDYDTKERAQLQVFQRRKHDPYECKYTWTLEIEQIKLLLGLLEKFAAGYWLGIHNLLGEED